uniref:Calpain family cysteine protease/Calpain large subunit, domain III, putative n=1 Tax=Theileria annulata TaxID=5874 RepID=A0A3B0MWW1_THEAN
MKPQVSENVQAERFEKFSSFVDRCFIPPWDHVVESTSKDFRYLNELISVGELWQDPSGLMELNSRQKKRFSRWVRYFELCDHLTFFNSVPTSERILQGYVGDCSTVSSLSSLAEYENFSGIPVLTDKIKLIDLEKTAINLVNLGYPEQCINYLGGYKISIGVKIFFNGCPRCMFIDDWVPVKSDNTLLCAHSKDSSELWVTLFEKANVRLSGNTYAIKGTNPGVDIYHLTGWIPEIIQLPPFRFKLPNDHSNPLIMDGIKQKVCDSPSDITNIQKWESIWESVLYNFNKNSVLCLGTNELYDVTTNSFYIEGISVSSGIVSGHAYSVLNVLELCVSGMKHKLLLLKNPWGKVSSKIQIDPMILSILPSNNNTTNDVGIFWIEWDSVLKWFSHLYFCWNTEMFGFVNKIHFTWGRNEHFISSPVPEDSYLSMFNPQILVSYPNEQEGSKTQMVDSKSKSQLMKSSGEDYLLIYAMLIQNRRELGEKMKYLATHIFEGNSRIIIPNNPLINGVYNNSEIILTKLLISPYPSADERREQILKYGRYHQIENKTHVVNLIILLCYYMRKMQENSSYTLITYSNKSIKLLPLSELSEYSNLVYDYRWSSFNNGMNPNEIWSFFTNPQFRLEIKRDTNLIILLETDSEISVNLRLFFGRLATIRSLRTKQAKSSNEYKLYCCSIHGYFKKGTYTLIPSNFNGVEANFKFNFFFQGPQNDTIQIYPIPYPFIKLYHMASLEPNSSTKVDREYKIDETGDELVERSVSYQILNHYHVTVLRMTNHYLDFTVDQVTLLSIKIKVNSINDNKFVLFSTNTTYPNLSQSSCSVEDNSGNDRQLNFCSDVCCFSCGGPYGQFYPISPNLFPKEHGLGYKFSLFSDLNGGISKNGKTPSNSSQVLFTRELLITFTLANLFPNSQYRLVSINQFKFQKLFFISNFPITLIQ